MTPKLNAMIAAIHLLRDAGAEPLGILVPIPVFEALVRETGMESKVPIGVKGSIQEITIDKVRIRRARGG